MTLFPARWSPARLAVALLITAPVYAADARLERVVLLPAVDRSSIVFELSAEPQSVSTRRISDSVVELDAIGVETAAPKLLKAPANVRFIDSVTVRTLTTDSGPVIRARITLSATARAFVRAAGRRVYVDVSAVPMPSPAAVPNPSATQASFSRPAAPAPRVTPEDAYRAAVRPTVDKLKEMSPFLISAAASGDPKVTGALLPTVLELRTSLAAQQPPDAVRGSHTMVLGAVDRIMRALSPDFTGDRGASIKQSVTTIDVVGGVLIE